MKHSAQAQQNPISVDTEKVPHAIILNCPVAEKKSTTIESKDDAWNIIKPFTPDALANGGATLAGALIGAMLAYLLQRKFQKSLEKQTSILAGHQLMFALLQQVNTIILIQRDFVQPHLEDPAKFISIPASPPFDLKKNTLEPQELAFLLGDKAGRILLYKIYIAQDCYVEVLNQWNIRSELHYERMQPTLAAAGFRSGIELTEDEMETALGIQLYGAIISSTANCIESLSNAFNELSTLHIEVRNYLTKRFPKADFIKFDLPDTYGFNGPP
jgi:hypothetical protein